MSPQKKTMKVTYFQNNFSKYQLRPYTLRFRNQQLEKQYQEDRYLSEKIFTMSAIATIICLSIAASIQEGLEGQVEAVVLLSVNVFAHLISLFKIKQGYHYLRRLIFILNIYSTFCYSVFLSTIEDKLTVGQILFLEDIYVYSLILFMKTHTFLWDTLLILTSRIIILMYSILSIDDYSQTYKDIIILSSLCIISGILQIFSLFKNEKLRREAFLNSKQREQWNLIVDEVLPINVIISKFNSITGEISLNASNQEAQQNFKVSNDESFNYFMQKIRLDSPNSKKTLRDFILEKHHSIALQRKKRQDLNIKPLVIKSKQFTHEMKSLQDQESQRDDVGSVSPSRVDRNPSIKKMITQRSIVKKKMSFSQDNSQKFVEILKGYYCEDWENKPQNRCQYKIQVFQFSVNEPLLLINVENNQEQENIKILKTTKSQYRELFKDTLYFFQDRIIRLSSEIGQVAIPISQSNLYYDLKYSLMSVFTGIHNILDFVFERGIQPQPKDPKDKDKEQQKENHQNKSPQKPKKKDSFHQQLSPLNSIENELNIIENGQYSFHGNVSSQSQNNQNVLSNNNNNNNNNINFNSNISNLNSNINNVNSNINNLNNNSNSNNNNNINVNNKNINTSKGQNSSAYGVAGPTMGNTKIRSFSLRKLLNEVSDVMFEKCKQKKIMFFFSDLLGEETGMIQDQRRVKQVLFNYLQNALDTITKGYIAITVRPFTNLGLKTYRFEIMDSGPGINEILDENNIQQNPSQNQNQMQVVSLRKKSQNQQKQLRKLSSFSNYFQNITTANPQSKIKGLGIAMKVNQKVVAKLGPYFPKIYSAQGTGTHIVYELYADILAIRNLNKRYRSSIHKKEGREEDVPEDEEIIGLSCYKYTRNEIYHFSKNPKTSNLLLSPDSTLAPNTNNNNNNFNSNNINSAGILNNNQQYYLASTSNYMPSVVQSMLNLNTPIIIPSNVSTIPGENQFNQSMPLRSQSSLLQVEPAASRHRPDSMDNAISMKVSRSNQYAITTTQQQQQNNSFTLESFRSRDRSRQDSFFADMNNRKRLINAPNQLQLNLNGSDDGIVMQNPIYYNGSYTNPNNHNYNPNLFHPYKKYSLHDLSNYS